MGGVISSLRNDKKQGSRSLPEIKTEKLDADDFEIGKYIAEGGSGKIHKARRKADGTMVALKFFGYIYGWEMDEKEIIDEMNIMASMNHVESVIRIYGYFFDTPEGRIPRKVCPSTPVLPVIVMEYMGGGPLFGRLNYQEVVSEKYLASVFRAILVSVNQLHKEGFVHRDLKLENIMFVNTGENSPVRIIDLGMSAKLESNGYYIDKLYLVGTPGFYAPESILSQQYSVKTDVWQLGCILYMLLSGLTPFHREKQDQITHRGYYKMAGKGWTDISADAKDLVHKILKRKSADRLSIEQILDHPWMSEATETVMDTDYKTRIKRLALRDKMQNFFRESKLSVDNAERQKNLIDNVPLLSAHSNVKGLQEASKDKDDTPSDIDREVSEFNSKLKKLKTMVVKTLSADFDHGEDSDKEKNKANTLREKEIDYETFVSMLHHCHLEELCTPAVFNIFDIGNTGTVNPKEFLMTMIAFRPVKSTPEQANTTAKNDNDADARLYFEMFDIHETGVIEKSELRLAVKFLLFMGADEPQDLPNVEEMFNTIDLAKNGTIDFEEFKIFYEQMLLTQNSTAVRVE